MPVLYFPPKALLFKEITVFDGGLDAVVPCEPRRFWVKYRVKWVISPFIVELIAPETDAKCGIYL